MALELRYNTAGQEIPLGYMLDSTDGDSEETGLTIANTDIKIWKWGATTLANKNSGGGTHISNGVYYGTFDATDTNTLGPTKVFVHVSGSLAFEIEINVVSQQYWDAKYGSGAFDSDVTKWLGTAAATPTVAGVPEVDLTHIIGTILTEGGAGRLSAAFIKLLDVATPLLVASDVMRGTNLAALASVCTEGRLAELDAANLPTTTDNILTDTGTTLDTKINTIDTVVDAIKLITDALPDSGALTTLINHLTDIKGTGFVKDTDSLPQCLTATGFSTHAAADIWSVVTRALTDKAGFTISGAKTTLDALNDIAVTDIVSSGAITTLSGAVVNVDTVDTCTTNADMVSEPPTALAIADQIWDEAKSGHVGTGSFGEEVQSHSTSSEVSALNNLSAVEVNTEVVDALNVDTYAEPSQGTPPATTTLVTKINYLYKFLRNLTKSNKTTGVIEVYNDAKTVVDHKATISDDGTIFTRDKFESGP